MKKGPLIFFIAVATITAISVYLVTREEKETLESYTKYVIKQQQLYRKHLVESEVIKNISDTSNVNFYKPDLNFRVWAKKTPLKRQDVIHINTSTGGSEKYMKHTILTFTISDTVCKLTLLRNTKEPFDYFLPYSDQTTGRSTYGTGRYVYVEYGSTDSIELDFNIAHNPYCAYNHEYSCPVPPSENRLKVAIFAGEKNFTGK